MGEEHSLVIKLSSKAGNYYFTFDVKTCRSLPAGSGQWTLRR